ncbi:MAG: hypothetical protein NTX28_10040 [Novosphingobium sp.]|nr:hypothetical protein [Novosphingobium sp.]
MIGLTPRQADLLRFIRGYQIARGGVSPSVRECQRGLGLNSTQSIHRMMVCLEERGAMRRARNWARAIEVLMPVPVPSINGSPLYVVPMVGVRAVRFSEERL